MNLNLRAKGTFLAIIGTMLWGISGTVAQFLFQNKGFNPEWLVVIRLLLSGTILLLYGYIRSDKDIKTIWKSRRNRIDLLLFSILGMLGVQYTYFAAISHGNASTATILQYLSPVIITCYLIIKNKKLPSSQQIFAISLAMIGTFFIITKGNIHSLSLSKAALFWGVCSAICAAIYTLQPISLLKQFSSTAVIGWGMLIGGLFFSFINPPFNFIGIWSTSSILSLVFIVIFGTIIAFYCYLESLKYLIPIDASILSCVEPLSATFLSAIWLNTLFGLAEFTGIICVIVAVITLSFTNRQ